MVWERDFNERLSCIEVLNKWLMRVSGTGICFQRSPLSFNVRREQARVGMGGGGRNKGVFLFHPR